MFLGAGEVFPPQPPMTSGRGCAGCSKDREERVVISGDGDERAGKRRMAKLLRDQRAESICIPLGNW